MEPAQSRELRAAAAWALAIAGHALLVMAFVAANRSATRARTAVRDEPLLVLIDFSATALPMVKGSAPQSEQALRNVSAAHAVQRRVVHAVAPALEHAKEGAIVATPAEAASTLLSRPAPIDWQQEAALAGRRAGAAINAPGSRGFGATPAADTQVCVPSKRHVPWNRELKRAGFVGALPYVRLSKRCMVGLPFFGCAIGHLPEADSALFSDMGEVDRARSSVPEIPDCVPPAPPIERADPASRPAPASAAPR